MKLRKHIKLILLVLFVAICVTNCSECDDDDYETVESDLNIVGTWILKSAEFREGNVDLDGDGPMLPMNDVKYFLFDLFDLYANCSSIDEIPIQFSEEIASLGMSGNPTKYFANAVCPEGQGITSSFALYYLNPESRNSFILEIDELNDPAGLINWDQGFIVMFITDEYVTDGITRMIGSAALYTSNFHYHRFDYILEEYIGD